MGMHGQVKGHDLSINPLVAVKQTTLSAATVKIHMKKNSRYWIKMPPRRLESEIAFSFTFFVKKGRL